MRPYDLAESFEYRGDWTGHLFAPLRTIVRVMGIDSHLELTEAWAAMANRGEVEGTAFSRLEAENGWPSVRYQAASGRIREFLKSKDAVAAVQMQRELGEFFRKNYRTSEQLK